MATPESLRRLQKIRETEEHMMSSALQSAIHELYRFENALHFAREQAGKARGSLPSRLASGCLEDRVAGFEEIAAADRLVTALSARISLAQQRVNQLRSQFIQTRIQRQQTQTLLEQSVARDKVAADRKAQVSLDEWHRAQVQRDRRNQKRKEIASSLPL
jgi:flagellar export protein FliJ